MDNAPVLHINKERIAAMQKITIAIFFHEEIEPSKRYYWIGILAKDGSCQRVIKTMRSAGAQGLSSAIKYLETL